MFCSSPYTWDKWTKSGNSQIRSYFFWCCVQVRLLPTGHSINMITEDQQSQLQNAAYQYQHQFQVVLLFLSLLSLFCINLIPNPYLVRSHYLPTSLDPLFHYLPCWYATCMSQSVLHGSNIHHDCNCSVLINQSSDRQSLGLFDTYNTYNTHNSGQFNTV